MGRRLSFLVSLTITIIAFPVIVNVMAANIDADDDVALWGALAIVTVITVIAAAVTWLLSERERRAARTAAHRWRSATDEVYAHIEKTLPQPQPKLEDEIADVSGTLTYTVGRLREISVKARAFEAEVQDMVKRADAAQATAELSEEAARRIGYLLGAQTEKRLHEEIEKLSKAHTEQIGQLRRSGTRLALLTFAGGVVLGTAGNIVVAAWMG